jgi:ubiquinone/menaquinone biosynthesis C-methylase UbiE
MNEVGESTHTIEGAPYRVEEMPGGVDLEVERLRKQTLMTWEQEARNLEWFGLRDGMAVLELGSGPGFVTEALLALLPNGTVTTIELDPVMVERARQVLAGKGEGRLTAMQGSAMSTGLPDDTFDFVYARYLFQHLPDPVGAAREVLRVLKPGGKLVIADIDDDMHFFDPPRLPEAEAIFERVMGEHAAKGGNRHIGRQLIRVLREAGFTQPRFDILPMHSDEIGIDNLFPEGTGREALQPWLEAGKITEEEVEILLRDEEIGRGPESITILNLLMASGEKAA